MKKLFFTALVAVAAIGGATAQYYAPGSTSSTPDRNCGGTIADCSQKYSGQSLAFTVRNVPAGAQQIGTNDVDLSDFQYTPE